MSAQRTRVRRAVLVLLLVAVVAVAPAVAQEASEPSGTLTGADITVDVGDDAEVTAQYSITFSSVGGGENRLSRITGTLWTFPDHVPRDFSATVNGESVDPTVTRHDRYIELAVPVSDVADGDTVTVTLTYTVPDVSGTVKTPLWVPNYQTTGSERVLDLTVQLPSGETPTGATFPKVDDTANAGSTLEFHLLHMPGFTYVQYAGGGLPLDTVMTVFGVGFIVVFFGVWLYYTRGIPRGGEASGS